MIPEEVRTRVSWNHSPRESRAVAAMRPGAHASALAVPICQYYFGEWHSHFWTPTSSVDFTCRAAYHSLRFQAPRRHLGLNVDGLFQFKDFPATWLRPAFSGFPGALPGSWNRLVHHLLDYQ